MFARWVARSVPRTAVTTTASRRPSRQRAHSGRSLHVDVDERRYSSPVRPVLTGYAFRSPFLLVSRAGFLHLMIGSCSCVFMVSSCLSLIPHYSQFCCCLRTITDRYLPAIPLSLLAYIAASISIAINVISRVRVPDSLDLPTLTITVRHNMANTHSDADLN